jgi:two-component system NtrC family sensor kinase
MAALSYLVAGVAHEVNTPLGMCVTLISLQLQSIQTLDAQYQAGQIKASTLQQYLQRSADLINRFKEVAVDQTYESLA